MPIPLIEAQKLSPSGLVELFHLDTTKFDGGGHDYFHAGTNELSTSVTWQGIVYEPWPITASGFAKSGQGAIPRPRLSTSNYMGIFSAYVREFKDLRGAKVERILTHVKHLDAVNFEGGNAEADPTMEYPREIWYVNRKTKQTNMILEFELATNFDLQGTRIPRGQIFRGPCRWLAIGGYRGPFCSYAGTNYFDVMDNPVGTLAEDRCAGRVISCEIRFGVGSELPYGSFPGAGLAK